MRAGHVPLWPRAESLGRFAGWGARLGPQSPTSSPLHLCQPGHSMPCGSPWPLPLFHLIVTYIYKFVGVTILSLMSCMLPWHAQDHTKSNLSNENVSSGV